MAFTPLQTTAINNLLFYGFGGHGQVVETALDSSQALVGFFDASLPKDWGDKFPYLGKYNPNVLGECKIIVTIGDNPARAKLVADIEHGFSQVISPLAFCAPNVHVGSGAVILGSADISGE
jgi:hypothetical protein